MLEEDKDSYIKKGFFFSVEYGAYFNIIQGDKFSAPGALARPDLLGHLGGISLGFDLGDRFNIYGSFLTTHVGGDGQGGGANGTYLINLGATIYFLRAKQLYVYAKLGAGLMLVLPDENTPLGVMAHAGFGIRYYTRMRHLSIGIEALGFFRIPTDNVLGFTLGVGLMPTLMYTF